MIQDLKFKMKKKNPLSRFAYRTGDIYVPKLDISEALFNMASDFVNSIRYGRKTGFRLGIRSMYYQNTRKHAQKSIKNKGVEELLAKN